MNEKKKIDGFKAWINRGRRMIYLDGKTIRYARYMMERHLKRPLKKEEIVHHRDGDMLNDDISNLEIMTIVGHGRLHNIGKIHTIQARQNMSKAQTGRIFSAEHCKKLSIAHMEKKLNTERKVKMSIAQKKRREKERLENAESCINSRVTI